MNELKAKIKRMEEELFDLKHNEKFTNPDLFQSLKKDHEYWIAQYKNELKELEN